MVDTASRSVWRKLVLVLGAFAFIAAGCGGDDGGGGSDGTGAATTAGGGSDTTTDGGSGSGEEPQRGGTLVYAVEADTSLPWDPTRMLCAAACHSTVGRTIFEPLVLVGEDGEIVPYLLDSISSNEDATVWTLVVRPGIKFHDGTDFTADAVKFNLDRQKQSLLVGPAIKLVTDVASDGANTVTVTMSDSWSAFPYLLNGQLGYIGSPTWETAADADPSLVTKPVGTGPFQYDVVRVG